MDNTSLVPNVGEELFQRILHERFDSFVPVVFFTTQDRLLSADSHQDFPELPVEVTSSSSSSSSGMGTMVVSGSETAPSVYRSEVE